MTANAVFAEHRVGAFQGRGDTNLDLLLSDCSPESNRLLNAISPKLPFNIASSLVSPDLFCARSQRAIELFWTSQES